MTFRLDQLKKLESASLPHGPERNEADEVEIIVKTNEPDYVPPCLSVRARIDPHLFTAKTPAKNLVELEHDAKVASVSLSKRLALGSG